jgi:hypothetical protein
VAFFATFFYLAARFVPKRVDFTLYPALKRKKMRFFSKKPLTNAPERCIMIIESEREVRKDD